MAYMGSRFLKGKTLVAAVAEIAGGRRILSTKEGRTTK